VTMVEQKCAGLNSSGTPVKRQRNFKREGRQERAPPTPPSRTFPIAHFEHDHVRTSTSIHLYKASRLPTLPSGRYANWSIGSAHLRSYQRRLASSPSVTFLILPHPHIMDRLNRMLQAAQMGMPGGSAGGDQQNLVDNSETVYISSLALLKMLRHGRAGVPMEVMGLMLGEFVDDFTVRVVDVFAMPQSGTSVSVESVDPVFQTKMMDMLRQTGRPETVVGWYHSHPGFGCWLSSVDINTQQSFEQLTPRAVAVVVDPIQSVKGKVVIDAFRLINPQTLMMGQEPRQTTSNLGHLNKPSIQALIHGLNRHYYSIGIQYRKTGLEENMLMNLHKEVWTEGLELPGSFGGERKRNENSLKRLVDLADGYEKRVREENELTKEQLKTRWVGKVDPKKHIEDVGQQLIEDNIVAVSRQMIDKEASVAKKNEPVNGHHQNGGMDIDEEL
jgi:26S proteasome regulatory subunit N11